MKFALVLTITAVLSAPSALAQTPAPVLPNYVGESGGTGSFPARGQAVSSLPGHTIYRPVALPRERLPIVLWANGACADNGRGYERFLREVASHGYFVVSLGPPRDTPQRPAGPPPGGRPAPPPPPANGRAVDATQPEQLIEGLDWAIAQHRTRGSDYYGRLKPSKVAVMGHSCGGLQTLAVSPDKRITTSVVWNSGIYTTPGGRSGIRLAKDMLATLHAPVAYFTGGPGDIAYPNAVDDFEKIGHLPVFIGHIDVGHGGTYGQENGGVYGKVAVDWLDWRLKGDRTAARTFSGEKCGLCVDAKWTIRRKRIR